MFGLVLGIVAIVAYVQAALGAPDPAPVVVTGLGLTFVGVVFARAGGAALILVGITAMWAMVGALLATAIAIANADVAPAAAFAGHVVLLWLLQQVLARQLGQREGRRPRSSGTSTRAAAPTPRADPWGAAPGYYLSLTRQEPNGPGTFAVFADDSAEFMLRDTRLSFDSIWKWTEWWITEGPVDLPPGHGLHPSAPTFMMKGPAYAGRPTIAIQPDDLEPWKDRFSQAGVECTVPASDPAVRAAIEANLPAGDRIVASCYATVGRHRTEPVPVYVTERELLWGDGMVKALGLWAIEVSRGDTFGSTLISLQSNRDADGVEGEHTLLLMHFKPANDAHARANFRVWEALEQRAFSHEDKEWFAPGAEVIYGQAGSCWVFLPAEFAAALITDVRAIVAARTEADARALRLTGALEDVPGLIRGNRPEPNATYDGRGELVSWWGSFAQGLRDMWPLEVTEPLDLVITQDDLDGEEGFVPAGDLDRVLKFLAEQGYRTRRDQLPFDTLASLLCPHESGRSDHSPSD